MLSDLSFDSFRRPKTDRRIIIMLDVKINRGEIPDRDTEHGIIKALLNELEQIHRQPAWVFLRDTLACGKTVAMEIACRYGFGDDVKTKNPLPELEPEEEEE